MTVPIHASRSRTTLVHLALLVLVAASFFVNSWGRDLWEASEPRYAQVAREVYEDGHWLVPHLGGEVYPEKPPLYFWLVTGAYALFGVTPSAVRFVPALSAAGVVFLTYLLGRRLYTPRAGLFAGLALGTSLLFMHLARYGKIDCTLTLLTTAALYLIAVAYFEGRRALYLPAYVLMGLAVLVKGPVGFLVPVLTLVVFLLIIKDARSLRGAHLLPGLAVVLAIVAAWLVPAGLVAGSDYINTILFKQSFGRVVASFAHQKPFYYHLTGFPPNFLPWIVFLPQAFVFAVRGKARRRLFPVVWFATVFVFFSLISGKRSLYLLGLFPAAALLVGLFFDDCLAGRIGRRVLTVPSILLAVLLVAAAVALLFLHRLVEIPDYSGVTPGLLIAPAVLLAAAGVVVLLAVLAKRHGAILPTVFVAMLALGLVVFVAVYPAMNEHKTARFICEDLLRARTDDAPVVLYGHGVRSGAYHFYTGLPVIEIIEEDALAERLDGEAKTYIIIEEEKREQLRPETTAGWRLVAARQVGHRLMEVFVSETGQDEPGT